MRRARLIILVLSLIISAFCIFYVAVGACAETFGDQEYSFPEEIEKGRAALEKWLEAEREWHEKSPAFLSMEEAPLNFTLYAPEYEGNWGMFEIEYTFKKAYLSDTIPEGMDTEKFADREIYREGKLKEGYTFLLVDAIIENKGSEKQMYLVNSMDTGGGLLGFSGQTFKNTAIFHKELYPEEPFETTLVFAVEKESLEDTQIYINNFGRGTPDGNCVYVDTGAKN